ncbi:hypothetical protein DWG24_19180 [Dickeya zeae]|jgi:hypothetical protein|uniref:Uncharacterized protein n=1 Tax=Dickeya zeae TaxID=204042 RepID=A0AAE7D0R7_9GAMM|nr:hypothetical protein DWG24_19180 [Dickeya zeae]
MLSLFESQSLKVRRYPAIIRGAGTTPSVDYQDEKPRQHGFDQPDKRDRGDEGRQPFIAATPG